MISKKVQWLLALAIGELAGLGIVISAQAQTMQWLTDSPPQLAGQRTKDTDDELRSFGGTRAFQGDHRITDVKPIDLAAFTDAPSLDDSISNSLDGGTQELVAPHRESVLEQSDSIIVHPPAMHVAKSGEVVMSPQLDVGGNYALTSILSDTTDTAAIEQEYMTEPYEGQTIVDGAVLDGSDYSGYMSGEVSGTCNGNCGGNCGGGCGPLASAAAGPHMNPLLGHLCGCLAQRLCGGGCCEQPYTEAGVGYEWMPYAPFVIQRAKPMNHFGMRFAATYGRQRPDRAEYFWAGPARRDLLPFGELSVDHQDFLFTLELGGPRFSMATEVPIRIMDPVINENHAGLGDIALTTRLVLYSGKDWEVTSVLNSYFNSGSARTGLGTGHVSLEPGVLTRWEYSDYTNFHCELKYFFPLGADDLFAGEIIRYGMGVSRLFYDGDCMGIIGTLELVGGAFNNGLETTPGEIFNIDDPFTFDTVDGLAYFNVHPGMRFIFDSPGDWRQFDVGVGGGFGLDDSLFDGVLMADVRWKF